MSHSDHHQLPQQRTPLPPLASERLDQSPSRPPGKPHPSESAPTSMTSTSSYNSRATGCSANPLRNVSGSLSGESTSPSQHGRAAPSSSEHGAQLAMDNSPQISSSSDHHGNPPPPPPPPPHGQFTGTSSPLPTPTSQLTDSQYFTPTGSEPSAAAVHSLSQQLMTTSISPQVQSTSTKHVEQHGHPTSTPPPSSPGQMSTKIPPPQPLPPSVSPQQHGFTSRQGTSISQEPGHSTTTARPFSGQLQTTFPSHSPSSSSPAPSQLSSSHQLSSTLPYEHFDVAQQHSHHHSPSGHSAAPTVPHQYTPPPSSSQHPPSHGHGYVGGHEVPSIQQYPHVSPFPGQVQTGVPHLSPMPPPPPSSSQLSSSQAPGYTGHYGLSTAQQHSHPTSSFTTSQATGSNPSRSFIPAHRHDASSGFVTSTLAPQHGLQHLPPFQSTATTHPQHSYLPTASHNSGSMFSTAASYSSTMPQSGASAVNYIPQNQYHPQSQFNSAPPVPQTGYSAVSNPRYPG